MNIREGKYSFTTIKEEVIEVSVFELHKLPDTLQFYCDIPYIIFQSCYQLNENIFILKDNYGRKDFYLEVDTYSLQVIREQRVGFFESRKTKKLHFNSELIYVTREIIKGYKNINDKYPPREIESTIPEAYENIYIAENGSILLLVNRVMPIEPNGYIEKWQPIDILDGYYFANEEDFRIYYYYDY